MSQGKVIIFKFRNILSFQNWVTTATHFRILFWTSDSHFTFKFNLGRHPRKTAERMKTVSWGHITNFLWILKLKPLCKYELINKIVYNCRVYLVLYRIKIQWLQ